MVGVVKDLRRADVAVHVVTWFEEVVKVVFVNSHDAIDVRTQGVCEPRGQRRWVGFVVDLRRAVIAEWEVTWLKWIVAAVIVLVVALPIDEPMSRSFKRKEHDADEAAWQRCDQSMRVPVKGLRWDELVLEGVVDEDDLDVVLVVMTAVMLVRGSMLYSCLSILQEVIEERKNHL